jgi:hypothetical protein
MMRSSSIDNFAKLIIDEEVIDDYEKYDYLTDEEVEINKKETMIICNTKVVIIQNFFYYSI